ncbi:MAG TPA: alpha/beta hydrolase, partial [Pseudonocardiaceae bacterium]
AAHREVSVNGISLHIAEAGEGPLVLLLHGWPESWYSWRHQFAPLADAGFHVVAPDQRGFGSSECPEAINRYSVLDMVGDAVGLINALGADNAVVVGHDWGAPVAWHTALLRPDLVRGVAGLSVAPNRRPPTHPLTILEQHFGAGFYQIYFQEVGRAEAELGADPTLSFRKILAGRPAHADLPPMVVGPNDAGLLDALVEPETLPDWLTEDDIAVMVEQYAKSGWRGGLNLYRNINRNWELTAAWDDARITVPSLYITGQRDVVRGFGDPNFLDRLPKQLPGLRGIVDLPDTGHWTQQERPAEVNKALLEFLAGL